MVDFRLQLDRIKGSTRQARRSLTRKLSCMKAMRGRISATFRVFFDDFLQHGLVEREVRHELLEPSSFFLEHPKLAQL